MVMQAPGIYTPPVERATDVPHDRRRRLMDGKLFPPAILAKFIDKRVMQTALVFRPLS